MSHGPRIRPEVRDMIWAQALDGTTRSRDEVASDLQEAIGKRGHPVPDLDTLKKMISKARTSRRPDPEDEPFSLGCLDRWVSDPGGQRRRLIDIHPEAVPAVLNAWKFALAGGRRLTVREAKWAGRLYRVTDDAMVLANWAHHYAMQEVATGAQTKDPDTSVSDANLTMTEMEFVAGLLQLKRIGRGKSSRKVLDPRAVKDPFDQLPPMDYDPTAARALMRHLSVRLADKVFEHLGMREAFELADSGSRPPHPDSPAGKDYWTIFQQRLDGTLKRVQDLLEQCQTRLAEFNDGPWVFARWLSLLMEGPRWFELEQEEREGVISDLCDWVVTRRLIGGGRLEPDIEGRFIDGKYLMHVADQREPSRLIGLVGYENPEEGAKEEDR